MRGVRKTTEPCKRYVGGWRASLFRIVPLNVMIEWL